MSGLFSKYQAFLTKHPVLTQMIQTGLLVGSGDIIAQTVVEKRTIRTYNPIRTVQFASVGFFIVGPALTKWYGILEKYIGSESKTSALKKVAADQLIFAPNFLLIFIVSINTLQMKPWKETKENLIKNYPDILKTNYKIWPFVQMINFYLMPLNYQVVFAQIVALFWNTYLSFKTQQGSKQIEE